MKPHPQVGGLLVSAVAVPALSSSPGALANLEFPRASPGGGFPTVA
jgi:hypothetical protein